MSISHPLPARQVGAIALRFIEQNLAGQVLAVVTGAVYLVTDGEDLFWLAQDGVPMHARAIQAGYDSHEIEKGMPFTVHGRRIEIGGKVALDGTTSAPWLPPALRGDRLANVAQVLGRIEHLREPARATGLPASARPMLEEIEAACSRRDIATVAHASQRLVGLGPGLTPSGDDFVGGLFFAVYHLTATHPEICHPEPRLVDQLLNNARTRTHLISYTLLHDYANGQGVEPLHSLLASILDRDAVDNEIMESARGLNRIGNTTGPDLLAGLLTGLKFLDESS